MSRRPTLAILILKVLCLPELTGADSHGLGLSFWLVDELPRAYANSQETHPAEEDSE